MKIIHICLTGPYTDNLSYQDNLLTKYHKKMGYEVSLIAPKYHYDEIGDVVKDNRENYLNEYGIEIIRLNNKYKTNINSKFKRYYGVYETIKEQKPDIIFIHGCQFLDIREVVKYAKKNLNVKIYVDNHADFSNSATNWLSKNILHKIIWRYCAQLIEPYTTKFYGVLPARVDFLKDIYKLPGEKLELLLMGADDEKVKEAESYDVRQSIIKYFDVRKNDFLIVTGGKIDNAKRQVLNLMNVVAKINNSNVKLLVYGSVIPEMQKEVYQLAEHESIEYIGWINDDQSYKLFSAADLVVFPGRHSVYWEQVVAVGTPLLVKYWEGTTHIDIGGNCKLLYEDTEEELSNILKNIIGNEDVYDELLKNAQNDKRRSFLYSNIAKKSVS